ncbi:MAG: YjbQ family protein [Bacteroidales bacterium]|nr:YjbQ family protein [Bacteroidales bacterium]
MTWQIEFSLPAFERGFHLITQLVEENLQDNLPKQGLLHLLIKHTSAGLTINENADPTVRIDFENIFNKLIPESAGYIHTLEGSDDMPAHIKSSLVGHSVTIPITNFRLNLGSWQGIYLCEFRNHGGKRKIVATIID